LIDFVNQLREQGLSKLDALLKGGRTRLRPVLMMAMTTILAMSMMVFSQDMGAAMSRSMALVTIGGLAYGTLMTLFVIPCIYDLFNRDKENFTENGEADGEAKRGSKKVRAKKVKALIEEMAAVEDLDK
jgi:HAE1 family hydrophobic/amphiphilic exporter-1